jgi:hypothetical protein
MDDLMDMIVADESPSQISDKIKEILFTKASDKVDTLRPEVSASLFGNMNITDQNGVDEISFDGNTEGE